MRCKQFFHILQLCLLLSVVQTSTAETVQNFILDNGVLPASLGSYMTFIEDVEGELSISDVVKSSDWRLSPDIGVTAGFTKSAYWLRFTVENKLSQPFSWNLEFTYPLLDDIELYTKSTDGAYSKLLAGDHQPFSTREINYRNTVIPLTVEPNQKSVYFVRLKTTSSMNALLKAWPGNSFYKEVDSIKMVLGFFYGVIFLALISSLVNSIFLKDTMYLWLSLSFLGISLYLSSVKGITFQYLWPDSIWWSTVNVPFFVHLGYIPTLIYCQMFTNIKKLSPLINKICIAFLCINAVGTILSLVLSYEVMIRFSTISASLMSILCIIVGMVSWQKGSSSSRLFVISWIIWFIASITFALTASGVFPRTVLTLWSQEFGFFCFVILMTIAQFDRFLHIQRSHEKKQASALHALSLAEEEYRSLFENAIEGIFQLNEYGLLTNANKTFSDITGIAEFDNLKPENYPPYSLCFLNTIEAQKLNTKLAGSGDISDFITSFTNRENETKWLSITIKKTQDIIDQSISFKGSVADITETKKREEAEKRRHMAEASTQAKDLFLANMSHEIRTPMNSIIDFTDKVSKANKDQNIDAYLVKIQRSSANLLGTINDILDFSKIEAGKLKIEYAPFSVRQLLANTSHVIADKIEEKGLHLRIDLDDDIPDLLIGDFVRLQQILSNLCNNAVKYSDKGEIKISLDLVSLNKKAGSITLTGRVSDSGKGISSTDQEQIFSTHTAPDTISNISGTGFGLSITKQLLELMDGNISVNSVVGQGSIFVFQFTCRIESRKHFLDRSSENNITETTNTPSSIDSDSELVSHSNISTDQVPVLKINEEVETIPPVTESSSTDYHIDQADGLERCQDNQKLYLKLFGDFIKNFGETTNVIRSFHSKSDLIPIGKLAHTLKGLAANLGAKQLSTCAMKLEHIERLTSDEQLIAINDFETELNFVVSEMQKSIDTSPNEDTASQQNQTKYIHNELTAKLMNLKDMVHEQKMDAYEEAIIMAQRWPVLEHNELFETLIESLDLFDFDQASKIIKDLKDKL